LTSSSIPLDPAGLTFVREQKLITTLDLSSEPKKVPMTTTETTDPGRGTQLLRATHRHQATELLRVEGPMSRTELAERLGLTRSAVTAIIAGLIDDGVLHELEAARPDGRPVEPTRGRPRVLVGCNPDAARVVGVQIGARRARVVLANAAGAVVDEASVGVARAGVRTVVDRVIRAATRLVAQRPGPPIAAAGICVPGSVDTTTGTVLHSDVLGWDGVAVAEMVGDRLGVPAFAQDVTQAATLAEALYGAAAGAANAIVLDYGGRIGVGLIVDGRLHRGSSGLAGSIGHTSVLGDTTPCRCGRSGCLEAVAGSRAILSALGQAPTDHGPVDVASFTAVVERARAGEADPRAAVARAVDHTAHLATMLIGLIDPDVLVLAGLVGRYPDFAGQLEHRIAALTQQQQSCRCAIRTSTLGSDAWVKGAVLVALQQLQPQVETILAGRHPATGVRFGATTPSG
jgi:predicted NBD/HSP70 family sugar kinase/biotin operon repressor